MVFPRNWWTQFETPLILDGAKNVWRDVLKDCHDGQLARGMERIKQSTRDFPPSAAQFRELCLATAEDLGVPSLETCYNLACQPGGNGDQFAKHMRSIVGSWELDNRPKREVFNRFKEVYQREIASTVDMGRRWESEQQCIASNTQRLGNGI